MPDLAALENILGFNFTDQTLLYCALTHRSYLNENPNLALLDNERLEFLGDAVLDFITGAYLYQRFPEMQEGQLTSLRAALVRTETLACFARQLGLNQHLLLGRGEEETGGRDRDAILCATFEALVGALYLDKGLEAVRQFIVPLIQPEIERILETAADKDAKSLLQELAQAWFHQTPRYRTVQEMGPDHDKRFLVEVLIGDQVYGQGMGRSKQAAAQAAAHAALHRLETETPSANGPAGLLPAPLGRALMVVLDSLADCASPWALGGSTGSALQGVPVEPHDLDLLTDEPGAAVLATHLQEYLTTPITWSENGPYASFWGQAQINGVLVEIIGGLVIRGDRVQFRPFGPNTWRMLAFGPYTLPVMTLEVQLLANLLIPDKQERAVILAKHLREHGCDAEALGALMKENHWPPEMTRQVWALLTGE